MNLHAATVSESSERGSHSWWQTKVYFTLPIEFYNLNHALLWKNILQTTPLNSNVPALILTQ